LTLSAPPGKQSDLGKYSLRKKRLRLTSSDYAAALTFLGKYSLRKKRLRLGQTLRSTNVLFPGKVFAEEEAIETVGGEGVLAVRIPPGKVFAEEEAIETA